MKLWLMTKPASRQRKAKPVTMFCSASFCETFEARLPAAAQHARDGQHLIQDGAQAQIIEQSRHRGMSIPANEG